MTKKLMKIVSVLAFSILCMLSAIGFSACDPADKPAHEHSFSSAWTNDEDYHWHTCTTEDCDGVSNKAQHTFEIVEENETAYNKCTVCGFKVAITVAEHEHTYSENWSKNDKYHWHACTVEGCVLKSDLAEHVFDNPEMTYTDGSVTKKQVCIDCGYETTEIITVATVIENENKWDDAFKNLKLVNYSLKAFHKLTTPSGTIEDYSELHADENGLYCKMLGYNGRETMHIEYYFMKNEDGSFDNYRKFNGLWMKSDNHSSYYYESLIVEATLPFSLEENFDKFVYDNEKGSYLSTADIFIDVYEINPQGEKMKTGTMRAFNTEVKIIDGAIGYIASEYNFPPELNEYYNEPGDASFVYWNIGTTKVTLPTAAKNAKEGSDDEVMMHLQRNNTEPPQNAQAQGEIFEVYNMVSFTQVVGETPFTLTAEDGLMAMLMLYDNGTAILYSNLGEDNMSIKTGTWEYLSENEYSLTMDGETHNGTIEDGTLTFQFQEDGVDVIQVWAKQSNVNHIDEESNSDEQSSEIENEEVE